jgi:hypothetical protein
MNGTSPFDAVEEEEDDNDDSTVESNDDVSFAC